MLAILAVVAGGVLGIVATQDERNSRQVTQERLDSIEAALRRHAFLTQSLPCPARGNVAVTNADFGNAMADANGLCTDLTTIADPDGMVDVGAGNEEVRIGTVPTRTLNLPDAYMTDGWGDRFTYAMVNMGMVTGILPVVGIPLPFISYGGTAMVTLGLALGILMSVARSKRLMQS